MHAPVLYLKPNPYGEILQGIRTALAVNEGIVKLCGKAGTGKTALCLQLAAELERESRKVVLFATSPRSVDDLQNGILAQLGLQQAGNFTRNLSHHLQQESSTRLVVVLDEAQEMDALTLNAVRMLCNIQDERNALVRVVLCGTESFDRKIATPEFRALTQYLSQSFTLLPLTREQTDDFCTAWWLAKGLQVPNDEKRQQKIFKTSGGLPGAILEQLQQYQAELEQEKATAALAAKPKETIAAAPAAVPAESAAIGDAETQTSSGEPEAGTTTDTLAVVAEPELAVPAAAAAEPGSGPAVSEAVAPIETVTFTLEPKPAAFVPEPEPAASIETIAFVPEPEPAPSSEATSISAPEPPAAVEAAVAASEPVLEISQENTAVVPKSVPAGTPEALPPPAELVFTPVFEPPPKPPKQPAPKVATPRRRHRSTTIELAASIAIVVGLAAAAYLYLQLPDRSAAIEPGRNQASGTPPQPAAIAVADAPAPEPVPVVTAVPAPPAVEAPEPPPPVQEQALPVATPVAAVAATPEAAPEPAVAPVIVQASAAGPEPAASIPDLAPPPASVSDASFSLATATAFIEAWTGDWQRQDTAAYLGHYHADYVPTRGLSREDWEVQRREAIRRANAISMSFDSIEVRAGSAERAVVRFWLRYRSTIYSDDTLKELELRNDAGRWQIVAEQNVDVRVL